MPLDCAVLFEAMRDSEGGKRRGTSSRERLREIQKDTEGTRQRGISRSSSRFEFSSAQGRAGPITF